MNSNASTSPAHGWCGCGRRRHTPTRKAYTGQRGRDSRSLRGMLGVTQVSGCGATPLTGWGTERAFEEVGDAVLLSSTLQAFAPGSDRRSRCLTPTILSGVRRTPATERPPLGRTHLRSVLLWLSSIRQRRGAVPQPIRTVQHSPESSGVRFHAGPRRDAAPSYHHYRHGGPNSLRKPAAYGSRSACGVHQRRHLPGPRTADGPALATRRLWAYAHP